MDSGHDGCSTYRCKHGGAREQAAHDRHRAPAHHLGGAPTAAELPRTALQHRLVLLLRCGCGGDSGSGGAAVVGGGGGMPHRDGTNGSGADAAYLKNTPIEITAPEAPVQFLRYGLVQDSGGPGRWRGDSWRW